MTVITAPGGRIDEGLTKAIIRIAVLSISDTRDEESDTSGHILARRITDAGHDLAGKTLVKDSIDQIRAQVRAWIDADAVDAIITTGGTGLSGRDVTVEALKPLFDKEIDGFATVFHMVSYQMIGTSTLQSRACAGLIDGVMIFCLPGSNGAVKDGWDKVIATQLDSRHKPCNLIELMPRFLEV